MPVTSATTKYVVPGSRSMPPGAVSVFTPATMGTGFDSVPSFVLGLVDLPDPVLE